MGPLATDNPRQAIAEFADHDRKIGIIQQRNRAIGGVKAIGDEEAEGGRTALVNSPPDAALGLVQAMSQGLSEENFIATISAKPIADGITGMMNSADGARMTAGMQAADLLWRRDPAAAEAAFKGSAFDKLHTWQGLRDSFSAAEIATNLNASRQPAEMKAREDARKAALTETDGFSASDVAYRLGTGWPGIGRITGSTPAPPADGLQAEILTAEYRQVYAALRADGVDKDKAAESAAYRLRSIWGPSAAAGNQLMRYPPDLSPLYPSIGGSKDWIAQDLNQWIAGKVGSRQERPVMRSLELGVGGGGDAGWSVDRLISDSQTATELATGRRPSYMVSIKKADGTSQILDGRVDFDPTSHIDSWTAKLEGRRQSINLIRENQFSLAMPLP